MLILDLTLFKLDLILYDGFLKWYALVEIPARWTAEMMHDFLYFSQQQKRSLFWKHGQADFCIDISLIASLILIVKFNWWL